MKEDYDDKLIDLDERAEIKWGNYIGEFEEKIYPHFRVKGYDKGTALILWMLNNISNAINDLRDSLLGDDSDGSDEKIER